MSCSVQYHHRFRRFLFPLRYHQAVICTLPPNCQYYCISSCCHHVIICNNPTSSEPTHLFLASGPKEYNTTPHQFMSHQGEHATASSCVSVRGVCSMTETARWINRLTSTPSNTRGPSKHLRHEPQTAYHRMSPLWPSQIHPTRTSPSPPASARTQMVPACRSRNEI